MNKRVMFAIACGVLTASLAQAAIYTSTGTGAINTTNLWSGGFAPISGDANEWLINISTNIRTSGTATTFYGHTLTVQAGTLRPSTAVNPSVMTMNNLVLNGGTITTYDNGSVSTSFTIDLSQDGSAGTFTLNSGNIKTVNKAGSQIIFRNGVLAGSGTINIQKTTATVPRVVFQDTISTVGFTGVFNVTGTLELPAISEANASFGLKITGSGKLYNTANIAVTNLVLGTNSIPSGTYTAADLVAMNAAYAAHFVFPTDTSSSITVGTGGAEDTYASWAATYGLSASSKTDDADNDGLLNVYEYGLGGNPTNALDTGTSPTYRLVASGGTNWFEYVHIERSAPNPGITYTTEAVDTLTGTWATNGVEYVGSGAKDGTFDYVTNRVSTAVTSARFIRLQIE